MRSVVRVSVLLNCCRYISWGSRVPHARIKPAPLGTAEGATPLRQKACHSLHRLVLTKLQHRQDKKDAFRMLNPTQGERHPMYLLNPVPMDLAERSDRPSSLQESLRHPWPLRLCVTMRGTHESIERLKARPQQAQPLGVCAEQVCVFSYFPNHNQTNPVRGRAYSFDPAEATSVL